jgi:nucleoside-diphosphate-sugar epimerase
MKQAFVTGATGFIGSALVEFLGSKGVEVVSLGRKTRNDISASRRARLNETPYIEIDMQDIEQLPIILSKRKIEILDDAVFYNLAWGGKEGLSDLNISSQLKNVTESLNALEVAQNLGFRKFIQIGTMEEVFALKYLEADHEQVSRKNRHIIYALAKISARRLLKVKSKSMTIEYNYVNHSHVMGEGDEKDSFLQTTLIKLIKNEALTFSSGEQLFDVISLQDCVEGYYLVGDLGKNGNDYWVGSGYPRRLREYVEIMYHMYPSKQQMQFGNLGYEEVVVDPNDFSTEKLVSDTGFSPKMSYQETVKFLYNSRGWD